MKYRAFAKAGMAALALPFLMILALAGCPSEADPGPAVPGGNPALTGAVKIQNGGADVSAASIGDTLTAVYTGTETVAFQWNKNGTAIASGGTSQTCQPGAAGNYTVTVSAPDRAPKTSAAVTVTATGAPNPDDGLTANQVAAYLAANPANTAAGPYTIKLLPEGGTYDIDMFLVNTSVQSGRKYVILDFSLYTDPSIPASPTAAHGMWQRAYRTNVPGLSANASASLHTAAP
jgi:hypothetical protein